MLVRLRAALVAVVLLSTAVVQGTSLVVFRIPTHIILAADSSETVGLGRRPAAERLCKIHRAGRWWTAQTGFHQFGAVNYYDLIVKAVSTAATLDAAANAVATTVFPVFDATLGPSASHFGALEPINAVAIAGTNAGDPTPPRGLVGHPSAAAATFRVMGAWNQCPGHLCDAGGDELHFATGVEPALSLTKQQPLLPWVARGDAAAARQLMQMRDRGPPGGRRASD